MKDVVVMILKERALNLDPFYSFSLGLYFHLARSSYLFSLLFLATSYIHSQHATY